MIAVIFEVRIAEDKKQEYLDIAASIRNELSEIDGFISSERFESLSEPGKFLSLSFFRDEEAVRQWRNRSPHRQAQAKGRQDIFTSYQLRVASIIRDYSLTDRENAPSDSKELFKK